MMHSKGPWTLTPRFQDKVDVIHAEPKKLGAASLTVARVIVRDSWLHEQTANARLIAAAPELLAALQRLMYAYSVSHSPEARQSCWDQARAAIAKANGEHQ